MRRIDPAVSLAVTEVKDKADQQPDDQSHPVGPAQSVDHRSTGDNAENRDEGRGGNTEPPFELGMAPAHHPPARANETECENTSNARHFAGNIARPERAER